MNTRARQGNNNQPLRALLLGDRVYLLAASLVALALRLVRLTDPAPRWDEGWSLAHARLPWAQLWEIATLEWHPPLYVALLKLWLALGKSVWSVRLLSVCLGVLAVPLAYAVAKKWSGRPRVGLLTALLVAVWPLLVYYGQVARMYVLLPLPVLAAAWFALRLAEDDSYVPLLGLWLSTSFALYVHYYTLWPLAAIWLYTALCAPRRLGQLFLAGAATLLAFVPWLWAARATLVSRISGGSSSAWEALRQTAAFFPPTLQGLLFTYASGWRSALLVGAILLVGALAGPLPTAERRRLALPALVLTLSVLGIAYGAQAARFFAARHLAPASAFVCLALAWAIDRLAARWKPFLPLALVALAATYWPASSDFVYQKTLEVVDPFDPSADHRYLTERTLPHDLVYFNVLARAGWYEYERTPQDASWSYTMRWDPIIEPLPRIQERVLRDSASHSRLWFVLYKGDYGPNADLKAWLDAAFYPAGGEWREDVLYLAYAAPGDAWIGGAREERFENGIRLRAARWNEPLAAGGACAIELEWQAERLQEKDYKVFVHLLDEAGRLVSQHDAFLGGGQLSSTWDVGQIVSERHALFLPPSLAGQRLRLVVGLYESSTNSRQRVGDGTDQVELGILAAH